MGRIRIAISFFIFVALVACAAVPVWAQEASGRIVGNVTDNTGSLIAGAKVTVTNEATRVSETATTGKDGFFQVLSLPIGTYSVTIEMTGFRKQVFEHQSLQINQSLRLDAKLEIGTRSEVVEVTSQAPNVETINPTLGESVTSRPIVNLPLDGRNTLDLALLQPGVMEANPDYTGDARAAGTFSVGGGRPDSITYLLDGGVNNDILSNGVVYNPNPDSVAEFRILTSNYTAEYGRNGAGVISVVTKSGTNRLHGSVFEFLRNGDFDANTFFNKIEGLPRDDLHRNQYGATIGGPITIPSLVNGKDRFFFFVAYQGQRQVQTVTTSDIPTFTKAELQGNFSQALPFGQTTYINSTGMTSAPCATAGGCPDPNVVNFLTANPYFAMPGGNATTGIIDPSKINAVSAKVIAGGLIPTSPTGFYSAGAGGTSNSNELTGRTDFVIDPKDSLTVTLGGFRNPELAPFGLNGANVVGYPSEDQFNNYFGSVAYTRNFNSHVLNEFRFTAQRHYTLGDLPAASAEPPSFYGFGITPDLPNGPPQLLFDTGLQTGFSAQGPRYEISNAYSYTDTVSWIQGRNTWKWGAGLSFYQTNIVYDFYGTGQFFFLGPGGIGTGNSFADFLLGIPDSLFEAANAANNLRSKSPYAFFQDEWRVKSNLTLTLGVRYEYSEPKTDTEGRTFSIVPGDQSVRFPNAPLGLVFPGDPGAPRGANFPDKNNFAPRIGFAWDPWKNGKTSIRGGFGIFYDVLKGEDNLQFNGAPPFYSEAFVSINGGASVGAGNTAPFTFFSDPWAPGVSPFPSTPPTTGLNFGNAGFLPYNYGVGGGGLFFVAPHLHTPYSYQYNLSVQHEIVKNLTFEINYVGSSSKGLTALIDVDPFVAGSTEATSATSVRVLNVDQPNAAIQAFCGAGAEAYCPFAIEPEFANVSFASYNSLEASLTKRLGDNRYIGTTYFTLGYTYGRSIDNASGFRNRSSEVPSYDIGALRGPSDFDLAQRLTFSGGWDLPFDRAWESGPKGLTTGWSLYPILTWRTGFPLSVANFYADDNCQLIPAMPGMPSPSPSQMQCIGNPANPGPSGAGDGFLANAPLAAGVTSIPTYDPKHVATINGNTGNYYFNPNAFTENPPTPADPYGSPRNYFYGPHRTNLDMALAKTTTIHENVKLEFRAEAFNLFNHTEFAQPNTNILSPLFGQITNTIMNYTDGMYSPSPSSRILQLALRLTF